MPKGRSMVDFIFMFKFCFWVKCEFPLPISSSFFSHCCHHLKWLPQNLVLLASCICCSRWPTSTNPGPKMNIFFWGADPQHRLYSPTPTHVEFFHMWGPILALPVFPPTELPKSKAIGSFPEQRLQHRNARSKDAFCLRISEWFGLLCLLLFWYQGCFL